MNPLTLYQKVDRRRKINHTALLGRRDRVISVEQLAYLAEMKRAVLCVNCWGLLPAVVVMNMAASSVSRAIKNHCIYQYEKIK